MRHQASWVRYLSIFLLAGFVSQDISWAADLRVSFAGSGVQADWIRPLKALSADAAIVEEVHEGRGPLIYLIRDAHTNPSAQFNLSKTLDHLIGSGELRWVFAEAGVGDNSLAPLKGLTSHDRIEAAARAWVRRGRMKGTEYLSVTSPRDFELQGIENPELYRESIRLYREVVKNRSGILAYLSRFMRTVQFLKNRYYSAELAEFDRSREACREDGSHAADCMAKLERAAQRLGLSQEPLSRLAALDQLKEREAAIDHDRLSREWAEWWKRSEDRRSERDFPEVHKYLVLQRQSQKVLTPELFEEAHDKELRVYAALARTPEAAGLVRADRQLRTIRRWVELEAEPRDGRDFEADPSVLDLVGIAAFLNRQLMDAGMDPGLAILLDRRLHPKIQSAIRFYQLTRLRDAYFMDQITSKIGDGPLKTAALITGGYHTDHLTRLFREKGWSYAVITPRVLEETYRARYERLLLNDFAPVSKTAGPGAFIASGASSRNHLDTPFMRRTGMGLPIPSTPAFEFAARDLGLTETAAEEALKTGARLSADQQLKAYLQTLNGKAVVILDAAMPFRAPEQPAAESRPKPVAPGDLEKELDAQVLSALEARPEGASAEDLWRTMSQTSGAPDLEAVEKSLERWVLKKKIIFNTWPLGQREEKVYEATVNTDEESAGDAETTEPAALPAADAEVDGRRFRPGAWTARQRSLGAALKSRVKELHVDLSQSKLIALKTLGLYREAIDPGVNPLKIGLVLSLNGLVVSGAASTADASVERLKYLDSDALLVAVGANEITDPGRAILRTLEFRKRKKQAQARKAAGIKIQPPRSEDTQAMRIRRRLEEDAGKVEKWLAERSGESFTAADIAKGLHGDRKPTASETSRAAHAAKFLIRSGRPVRSVMVGIKIKKVCTRYTNAYMYIGEKSSGARLAVAPQHYYPGNRRGDYWYGPIDQHRQDFLAEIKDRRMTHIKLGQILRMVNSPTSKVTRLASWGHPTHPSSNLRYTQYLVENEVYDHTGGFWWMNKDKNSRFSMVVERDPQMGDDWGRLWVFRESSPLHEPILKMNWKSYQEKKTSGGDWNSYDLMDEDTNRDTLGDTVSILEAKADFRGARLANRVFEIELRNPRGIHMWPSQQISNLANWIYQDYLVAIRIHDLNTGRTADADDVQGLLELKAEKGAKLELTLTGSHESLDKVEVAVRKFFESGREEMESKITRQDYLRDILGSEAGARLAGALDLLEDEKKKTPEEYAPNSYLFRFGKNHRVSEIVSDRETRAQSLQHADAYEVETGDRMFAGEEDYDWRGMREVKKASLQETNPSLDTGTAGTASCLSCGFMIVYNAASRETFYAHSYGTESLASWTRTIEDAGQRFKGSEKDVIVYMGGNDFYDALLQMDKYRELRAFLADDVPYAGGRRILKQLEAFIGKRERLSQRAIRKGFRVVQAFPAYIGISTLHTFDPESGTLLLEEEQRPGSESLPRLTPDQLLQKLRTSAATQAARLAVNHPESEAIDRALAASEHTIRHYEKYGSDGIFRNSAGQPVYGLSHIALDPAILNSVVHQVSIIISKLHAKSGGDAVDVLSLGAGRMQLEAEIIRRASGKVRLTPVELSPDNIAHAPQDLKTLAVQADAVEFLSPQSGRIAPDKKYDLILIPESIYFFNPYHFLGLVKSRLKPGGIVIVTAIIPRWVAGYHKHAETGAIRYSKALIERALRQNRFNIDKALVVKGGMKSHRPDFQSGPASEDYCFFAASTAVGKSADAGARLAERKEGGDRESKKAKPLRIHDDKEDQLLDEAMDIQEAMHDLEMLIRTYGEHVDTMLREIAGNKPPREQELEIFVFWAENSFVDYRRSLTYLINEIEGMLRNLKNLPPQPEFETSLVQHRDDSMRLLEALNEKYRARMPIIEFYQKLIDADREGRGARLSSTAVADFAAGILRAQPAAWAAENPRMVPMEDGRTRIALVRSAGVQTVVRYRGQTASVSNADSASADRSRGSDAASGARVLRDRANRRLKGILNSQDQAARILPGRLELPLVIFLNADELASTVSDPNEFVMQLEWAYRSLDRLERKTRNRGLPVRFTIQENSGAWTDLQRAAWADTREKMAALHTRIETIRARQASAREWTAELKTTAAGLRADESFYWGVRVEPGAESAWFETAALLIRAASDGASELSLALSEQRAPRSELFVPSDTLLGMARTFTRSRVSARMLPQSLFGRSIRLFNRLFVRPLGALLSESLQARRTTFQMYSQSA